VQNGRLTSDVLEKLHQQIVDEGMAKGQAEGYKVGHEQGFQKGQSNGYQAGYQEGKLKAEQEARQLQDLFEHLFNPLQDQQQRVEAWVLQSVKDICIGIMEYEFKVDEKILLPFVKEAVENLSAGSKQITVKLHPDDLVLVNQFMQQKSLSWNLLSDIELKRGDCYVSNNDANIDYSLSARVDQAIHAMMNPVAEGSATDVAEIANHTNKENNDAAFRH